MKLIDKSALVAEIERLKESFVNERDGFEKGYHHGLDMVLSFLDHIETKEVDLEKEIKEEYLKRRCYGGRNNILVILNEPQFNKIAKHFYELGLKTKDADEIIKTAEDHAYFAGSENTRKNLWHPADGDDLPEIDREVIVLLSNNKVCFAHRPQEYWDGKNIATEEITRYYPKRYDKGGWNIPDVKWWLDLDLPKMEE